MDESILRELMAGIVSETPVVTDVDLEGAIVTGHRRQRRAHRATLAGVAAIVVLVLVATAVVVAAAVRDGPRPVVRPPTPVAPTTFDPARTRLTAGWLPAGLDLWRRQVHVDFEQLDAGAGSDLSNVTIYLLAKGSSVKTLPILTEDRHIGDPVAGPAIHGVPSEWTPITPTGRAGSQAGQLVWSWAPEAHATVYVNGLPNAEAVAARIATNLRFAEQRLKLSFRIKAPVGAALDATEIEHTAPGRSYHFVQTYRTHGDGPGIDVDVRPINGIYQSSFDFENVNPTGRIGSWLAGVSGTSVILYDTSDNAAMGINGVPAGSSSGAALALARRVAESFAWVGDPWSPSTWK